MLLLVPSFISWVLNPTELITRVELAGALIVNSPFSLVWVAVAEFFTATVAPATGELPATTLPVTLC
jgi:hypothetical protein